LPSPNINSQLLINLPTNFTIKSIFYDFIASLNRMKSPNNSLRKLSYNSFRKLWKQLTPNIIIQKPRTDLCDVCQKYKNQLQLNVSQKNKETLLKSYKNHVEIAKLEREYYYRNTKLVKKEQQKNYNKKNSIINIFNLVNKTVHFSYD
jgi:hypothetical protein